VAEGDGLLNRCATEVTSEIAVTYTQLPVLLPPDLSLVVSQSPELAKLICSWPGLATAIRAGIMAMVKAVQ
jgi:hypothetical protein